MNKQIKNALLASPIFNLSLSSKELFHSNFLYWLAKNYPLEFGAQFVEFCQKPSEDTKVNNILREKNNIDLSFSYPNGQQIYLENKVKSIPYKEQLSKYSKSAGSDDNYILLSLVKPLFFSDDKLHLVDSTWYYLSYNNLIKYLENILVTIADLYHKQLLNDYISFLVGLVEIEKSCKLNESDIFNFHDKNKDETYKILSDLRIHDLYLKRKYEQIGYIVHNHLTKENLPVMEVGMKIDWTSDKNTISITHGMTRSHGLVDIKYKVLPNLLLGIQIQGEHYRMIVEDNNSGMAKKLREIIADEFWFKFDNFPGCIVYPKKDKRFNQYGNTFFYKSIKLGCDKKISEIIHFIIEDIKLIDKNISVLSELASLPVRGLHDAN